jgi:hypothetical protein
MKKMFKSWRTIKYRRAKAYKMRAMFPANNGVFLTARSYGFVANG